MKKRSKSAIPKQLGGKVGSSRVVMMCLAVHARMLLLPSQTRISVYGDEPQGNEWFAGINRPSIKTTLAPLARATLPAAIFVCRLDFLRAGCLVLQRRPFFLVTSGGDSRQTSRRNCFILYLHFRLFTF